MTWLLRAGKYLGGWKLYAAIGLIIIALSGVVWAQHQRIGNLSTQRQVLQSEVKEARAERARIEEQRKALESRLLAREKERTLLYAETNQLKNKVRALEDVAAIEWRAAELPESVRVLREDRLRARAVTH